MLAEFFDRLRHVSQEADGVQLATHKDLPDKIVLRHGGEHELIDVPPSRRGHAVFGYADILAVVADKAMASSPEVFHSTSGIVVHLDRGERRDRVSLPLSHTDRWAKLVDLQQGVSLPVRDIVRMLRFELHGTGIETIITKLSKIDFTRRSDGHNDVTHGRESLGKAVEAVAQQADDIPETFVVSTSVYSNPGIRDMSAVTVLCGIYLDVHQERVEIRVLADEMASAENAAQASIGAKLAADLPDVPIFNGHP